ncbi:flagellar hook-length control protein FliK [Alkaliphilus serpentinus]|nr:flagellar hook-length control protein FliK [Alkaliphilus serpentinus]
MIQMEKLIFANEVNSKSSMPLKKPQGQKSFGEIFKTLKDKNEVAKEAVDESTNNKALVLDQAKKPLENKEAVGTQEPDTKISEDYKEMLVFEEYSSVELIEEENEIIIDIPSILNLLQQLQNQDILNKEEIKEILAVLNSSGKELPKLEGLLKLLEEKITTIEEGILNLSKLDSNETEVLQKMSEEKALLLNIKEHIQKLHKDIKVDPQSVSQKNMDPILMESAHKKAATSNVEAKEVKVTEESLTELTKEKTVKVTLEGKGEDKGTLKESNTPQQKDASVIEFNPINLTKDLINEKVIGAAKALNQQQIDPQNVMNQVVDKIELLVLNQKSEMKLQLSPENLGTLTIKITIEDGVLTGKVFTANPQVKELLENNLNQLKINLGDKGINVSSLEVSVDQNNQRFGERGYLKQKQSLKRVSNIAGLEDSGYLQATAPASNPYLMTSSFDGTV